MPTLDTSGNVFYDIDQRLFAGDKSASIDGVVYATSTTSLMISIPNWNYLLFAGVTAANGGRILKYGYVKCRSFSVYDSNNVKLRDFIPVRFTNELGEVEGAMYDKVSKQLFRNQGTGKFIVGADKDMPYDAKVQYIETDGVASYIDTEITPIFVDTGSGRSVVDISFAAQSLANQKTICGASFDTIGVSFSFGMYC